MSAVLARTLHVECNTLNLLGTQENLEEVEMAFLSTTGRVRVRSRRLLLHLRDRSRSLHLHPATDRAAYFLSSRVRSRRLLFTPPRPIAQTTFPTRQSELQDSVEADLNKSKGQLVHLSRGGGRAQTLTSGQHYT